MTAPVDCEPDVDLLPDQAPVALQDVAPVVLHVSVADWPMGMLVRSAWNASVGAAGTLTCAESDVDPPGPVQVREKSVVD